MGNDLTGLTVSNTYGRLVQVINDKYYDGFGNPLNIASSDIFSINGGTPSNISSSNVFKIDFGGVQ